MTEDAFWIVVASGHIAILIGFAMYFTSSLIDLCGVEIRPVVL
jgi:hypothetical protein